MFFQQTWNATGKANTNEANTVWNQEWRAIGDCDTTAKMTAHCGL